MQHLAARTLSLPAPSSRDTPLQKSRGPDADKHDDGPQSNPLVKIRHRALMAKFDILKPVSRLHSFIRPGLAISEVVMLFS